MLFENRPADKTAKWRVTTRSFVVLLAYTLFIWWLEVLDLLAGDVYNAVYETEFQSRSRQLFIAAFCPETVCQVIVFH